MHGAGILGLAAMDGAVEGGRGRLRAFYEELGGCCGRHNPLAMQADLLRLCVLWLWGGVYLDWDMRLAPGFEGKPVLEAFLGERLLLAEWRGGCVGEFVIGAAAREPAIAEVIERFICGGVARYTLAGRRLAVASMALTELATRHGWPVQPADVFSPLDRFGRGAVTERTRMIHGWGKVAA